MMSPKGSVCDHADLAPGQQIEQREQRQRLHQWLLAAEDAVERELAAVWPACPG